ncbi:hypothetical protein FRB97_008658 [Tulasnella sp. 331]|nr:hypothetical protein FRB97_008658 [Tulasnella sp. 331]KAG8875373.1 hypothetical protein FRB98_007940 [Tulasnella sp. 332]
MQTPQQNQAQAPPAADEGRRSRFAFDNDNPSTISNIREFSLPASLRERAASQPPRRPAAPDALLPTRLELVQRRYESPFGAPGTPPPSAQASFPHWSPSRHTSINMNQPSSPSATSGGGAGLGSSFPSRVGPTRSLSFSTTTDLPSRLHSFTGESFPSTFEDEEEDELEYPNDLEPSRSGQFNNYGHGGHHAAQSMSFVGGGGSRGDIAYLRNARASALAAAEGSSRSRSQSLAAMNRRQLPSGGGGGVGNYGSSNLSSGPLPTPGSAGIAQSWTETIGGPRNYRGQPSSSSSGVNIPSGSPFHPVLQRNLSTEPDLSNMSPFVRDVGQILLDDGAAFRDLWVNAPGMNQFNGREDGGGSGTTSRRHSVSVVQPRSRQASSAVMGFSVIEDEDDLDGAGMLRMGRGWEVTNSDGFSGAATRRFGGGQGNGRGMGMITDDELAIDLNNLSLQLENQTRNNTAGGRMYRGDVSQPSSLPNFNIQPQQQPQSSWQRPSVEMGFTPTETQYIKMGGQLEASSPSAHEFQRDDSPGLDTRASGRRPSISPSRMNGGRQARGSDAELMGMMGEYSQAGDAGKFRGGGMQFVGQQHQQQQVSRGSGPLSLMNIGGNGVRGPASASVAQSSLSPTLQRQASFGNNAMSMVSPSASTGNTLAAGYFGGATGTPNRVPAGNTMASTQSQQTGNVYGYSPLSPTTPSGAGNSFGASSRVGLSQIQTGFSANAGAPLGDTHHGQQQPPRSPNDRYRHFDPSQGPAQGPNAQLPAQPATALSDLGRGVPLHSISSSTPLYIIEFKAGRSDLFFCADANLVVNVNDVVIVEADRGRDLGKVVKAGITGEEVELFQRVQAQRHSMMMGEDDGGANGMSPAKAFTKEIMPKRLYGKATQHDIEMLATKGQDEAKALQLCQNKVRAKKLPMEVVEAEYQWLVPFDLSRLLGSFQTSDPTL